MPLPTTIPQDIIDTIISCVHDDAVTLECCSVVSHAFYRPTRKHLFSTIVLNKPNVVSSLNRTLRQNPWISGYIHTLKITNLSQALFLEVVPVLPVLTQTRFLELGTRGAYHQFPDISSVLCAILKLPHIERLEIFSIYEFPEHLLQIPRQIKWLTLENVAIRGRDAVVGSALSPLLPLTSINLHRLWCRRDAMETPFLNAPNLRQVVFSAARHTINHGELVPGAQTILQCGAESIEDVIWCYYIHRETYTTINLEVLQNLRRLSFILDNEFDNLDTSPLTAWSPINNILHRGQISLRLEVLNFAIIRSRPLRTSAVHSDEIVGLGDVWTNLANRVRFPKLKRVTIYLEIVGCGPSVLNADTFQSVISQKVPLLAGEGLLHATLCEKFDWRDVL